MIYSMILIDEMESMGTIVKFYDGIDFNVIGRHPKDGTNGFLCFFVDKWVDEVKIYKRQSKIDSIIGDRSEIIDTELIDNNYVVVYQTDGNTKAVYGIVKDKFKDEKLPYTPISGIKRGIESYYI
jgi:hypothetical protein